MIHLYTGDGKGKTTAALGLGLRAAGAGMRVYMAQFMKKGDFSEVSAAALLAGRFTIEQFGQDEFYFPGRSDYIRHRETAARGLTRCREVAASRAADMLILDEAVHALNYSLITLEELCGILDSAAAHMEIIITGRDAPDILAQMADLVTEMKEIKHYYHGGFEARKGVEF